MPASNNTLLVHDSVYELTRHYKEGARAFRANIPWNCNPYRSGSMAHDAWSDGHVNDSAGEHFRFGLDVLAERRSGRYFEMDPAVPRDDGGDVDNKWEREQRKKFGLTQ